MYRQPFMLRRRRCRKHYNPMTSPTTQPLHPALWCCCCFLSPESRHPGITAAFICTLIGSLSSHRIAFKMNVPPHLLRHYTPHNTILGQRGDTLFFCHFWNHSLFTGNHIPPAWRPFMALLPIQDFVGSNGLSTVPYRGAGCP